MSKCALTTIDNPYDPFTDFENWFQFDIQKQYYSCSRLARLTDKLICNDMCECEIDEAIEEAIDRIIELDPLDIYIKVKKEEKDEEET